MGSPTREIALRKGGTDPRILGRKGGTLPPIAPWERLTRDNAVHFLGHAVPNRLAGAEINDEGDAI